jgi:hypothetical protein
MTTLLAESSPELSGQTWLRVVALYGVGPLLAVILVVWLTKVVNAKQDTQLAETLATKAIIVDHGSATREQLDRIGRQLEVNCRVQALLAKNKAVESLCEVGR